MGSAGPFEVAVYSNGLCRQVASRRTFASLDEAKRHMMYGVIEDAYAESPERFGDGYVRLHRQARLLGSDGGEVPLPDGRIVKLTPVAAACGGRQASQEAGR